MIDRVTNLAAQKLSGAGKAAGASSLAAGGASFADTLKQQIGEVAKMQQDASNAVQDVATGKTDDVTGVFVAMEKSETAFKTLLAIRSKLLDAYDEIKKYADLTLLLRAILRSAIFRFEKVKGIFIMPGVLRTDV